MATYLAVALPLGGTLGEVQAGKDYVFAKLLAKTVDSFQPTVFTVERFLLLLFLARFSFVIGKEVELNRLGLHRNFLFRDEPVDGDGDSADKQDGVGYAPEQLLHIIGEQSR